MKVRGNGGMANFVTAGWWRPILAIAIISSREWVPTEAGLART